MQASHLVVAAVLLVALVAAPCRAGEQFLVNPAMKEEMVDSICVLLMRNYVFEDQAARITRHVRGRLKKGAYDAISDPEELAAALTTDLQSVNQDRHLRVRFAPESIAIFRADTGRAGVGPERIRESQNENFGFHKLEWLPGNIGYLDLHRFESTSIPGAGQTAVAAMQFLAHSRAVIFDLGLLDAKPARSPGVTVREGMTSQMTGSRGFDGQGRLDGSFATLLSRVPNAHEAVRPPATPYEDAAHAPVASETDSTGEAERGSRPPPEPRAPTLLADEIIVC